MENYTKNASAFKALADPTRLKIIDMLSCGELCACVILEEFSITQPTLSYHMKILTKEGLVIGRKEGSWVHYRLQEENLAQLKGFFETITTASEDCICHCCTSKKEPPKKKGE